MVRSTSHIEATLIQSATDILNIYMQSECQSTDLARLIKAASDYLIAMYTDGAKGPR